MRLNRFLLIAPLVLVAAPLRAEYIVLRSGQRLHATGYERIGDSFHVQMAGGFADVPAADVVRIEPEDYFPPLTQPSAEKIPYRELIQAAAQRQGVDADLITSVIAVESNFEPRAISRRNARGLMQLLPETAQRLGVQDIFDPRENIEAGTRYLKELLARYNNDLVLALAAYNAGPDRVQTYGNVPPFAETRAYVRRVKHAYDERKSRPAQKATKQSAGSEKKSKTQAAL